MGFLKGIVNAIADPRLFFLLAVSALVVLVWKRDRIAANAVGYGLMGFFGIFFAFGSLDRYEISPRPGQVLLLRVGMRGDAHIIVGGRTLIEYAFEPIRQLRESMKQ